FLVVAFPVISSLVVSFFVVSFLVGVFLIDRLLLRDLLAWVGLAFLRVPSSYKQNHPKEQQENCQDTARGEGRFLPLRQPGHQACLVQDRVPLAARGLDGA